MLILFWLSYSSHTFGKKKNKKAIVFSTLFCISFRDREESSHLLHVATAQESSTESNHFPPLLQALQLGIVFSTTAFFIQVYKTNFLNTLFLIERTDSYVRHLSLKGFQTLGEVGNN